MRICDIRLHPTERTLYIVTGEWDNKKADKYFKSKISIDNSWSGAYVTAEVENNFEPILWVKRKNSKPTFIHEIVHCVTDLMKTTGIIDDEFRAWYTEWLFNTVIDALSLDKQVKEIK